jgi:hypothetical protein
MPIINMKERNLHEKWYTNYRSTEKEILYIVWRRPIKGKYKFRSFNFWYYIFEQIPVDATGKTSDGTGVFQR